MPAFLIPIIAAVTAALPIVLAGAALLLPLLLPVWYKSMKRADREKLVGHLKGAADLVAAVAKMTPMTWDDQIAAIIRIAADEGAKIDKQPVLSRAIAESLVAKSDVAPASPAAVRKVTAAVGR